MEKEPKNNEYEEVGTVPEAETEIEIGKNERENREEKLEVLEDASPKETESAKQESIENFREELGEENQAFLYILQKTKTINEPFSSYFGQNEARDALEERASDESFSLEGAKQEFESLRGSRSKLLGDLEDKFDPATLAQELESIDLTTERGRERAKELYEQKILPLSEEMGSIVILNKKEFEFTEWYLNQRAADVGAVSSRASDETIEMMEEEQEQLERRIGEKENEKFKLAKFFPGKYLKELHRQRQQLEQNLHFYEEAKSTRAAYKEIYEGYHELERQVSLFSRLAMEKIYQRYESLFQNYKAKPAEKHGEYIPNEADEKLFLEFFDKYRRIPGGDFSYAQFSRMVDDFGRYQRQHEAVLAYNEIKDDIGYNKGKFHSIKYPESQDLTPRIRMGEDHQIADDLARFVRNGEGWEVFRTNEEARNRFGREVLDGMDSYLTEEAIRQELGSRKEERPRFIESFQNERIAPMVLMKMYQKEEGYEKIAEYFSTFSKDRLEELANSENPDLQRIAILARENPDTFTQPFLENPDTGESYENPAKKEVELAAKNIALAALKSRDTHLKVYAARTLAHMGSVSEVKDEMRELLEGPEDVRGQLAVALAEVGRNNHDQDAIELIVDAYGELQGVEQTYIKHSCGQMLDCYIEKKQTDSPYIEKIANIMGEPPDSVRSALEFCVEIGELEGHYYSIYRDLEQSGGASFLVFEKLAELNQNKDIIPFLSKLPLVDGFQLINADRILEAAPRKDEIIAEIEDVRTIDPGFEYSFSAALSETDPKTGNEKKTPISDTYEMLINQRDHEILFEEFSEFQKRRESGEEDEALIPRKFSDAFLRVYRLQDPRLLKAGDSGELDDDIKENFQTDFSRYVRQMEEAKNDSTEIFAFYKSLDILKAATRNPEDVSKILEFPKQNEEFFRFINEEELFRDNQNAIFRSLAESKDIQERADEILALKNNADFFELIKEGGSLYSNKDLVFSHILEAENISRRAREIVQTFRKRNPYWKQLYFYTKERLGDELANARSEYPIHEVGGSTIEDLRYRHIKSKERDPHKETRLEKILRGNAELVSKMVEEKAGAVPFRDLKGEYKQLVFRDYLRRTIETSRDAEEKQAAGERNRASSAEELRFEAGMYVHGSAVDYVDSVLTNGNLPQEALGENSGMDSFPFHVDFSRLYETDLSGQRSAEDAFGGTISGGFGKNGKLGEDGQMFYLYKRSDSEWEKGVDFGQGQSQSGHALMFGGVPSTEISAIVLRSPEKALASAKESIIANSMYIPIYDMEGKLIFSQEEYEDELDNQKPYHNSDEFLQDQSYLEDLDKAQASGLHKFTLKEHLLRTTEEAGKICDGYGMPERDKNLVMLAARLHDIGKGTERLNTDQWFDNPMAALPFLKQVRDLGYDERELIVDLISNDELLGDIVQGKKSEEEFFKKFSSKREQTMLLALYQADVLTIDGTGDLYRQWGVKEALEKMGLEPAM